MRARVLFLVCALLAAVPATAGAGNTRDRATGGGQAFLDSRDQNGAGDTVAFSAHRAKGAASDSDAATGQIQVNRRGDNAVKFHGNITCLVVNGGKSVGTAYMSGTSRGGTPFELYVSDGGKGQDERNDMIMLFVGDETTQNDSSSADGPCGFDEQPDGVSLARGNVQTYNGSTDEDQTPPSASSSLSAALGALLN
jgi:hypothetical protein